MTILSWMCQFRCENVSFYLKWSSNVWSMCIFFPLRGSWSHSNMSNECLVKPFHLTFPNNQASQKSLVHDEVFFLKCVDSSPVWSQLSLPAHNLQTVTQRQASLNVLWTHMFSILQLLALLVQHKPWNAVQFNCGPGYYNLGRTTICWGWLPACLSARDNLGLQTRGDSNSLPQFLSSIRSLSVCPSASQGGDLMRCWLVAVQQPGFISMNLFMPICLLPLFLLPKSPFPSFLLLFSKFHHPSFSSDSFTTLSLLFSAHSVLHSQVFTAPQYLTLLHHTCSKSLHPFITQLLVSPFEELWLVSLKWFSQNFKNFTSNAKDPLQQWGKKCNT